MPPTLKGAAQAVVAGGKINSGEAVKVIVRCRPMNRQEISDKRVKCVEVLPKTGQITIKSLGDPTVEPKTFTFDGVYDHDCRQRDIYDDVAHPLVEQVLEGYNGTIFAYGQTGCGKSFTMMGADEPPELRGVIPNAFVHIFNHISQTPDKEFLIRASFIEIYNEEIRDLLGKDHKKSMELKEDPDKGVFVKDLTAVVVKDYDEIDEVMKLGTSHRSVGATAMNADSSRSHSLFTVVIEMSEKLEDSEEVKIKAGKLNLVDLAGSERQSKTQAEGVRLKEATKINLSLSALGNVIAALAGGKGGHIPYRDSKLTRLLQSSLGGNTKTVMCANVGPAEYNYDETLSTLRYANRAKNIKNKPKINEDPKDALLREFQDEIARLQSMLEGKGPAPGGGGGGGGVAVDMNELVKMKEQMNTEAERAEAEKREMKQMLEKERRERELINQQLAALEAKLVSGGGGGGDGVAAPILDGPTSPARPVPDGPGTPAPIQVSSSAGQGEDPTGALSPGAQQVKQAQVQSKTEEEQLYFDEEATSLQEELDGKTKKLDKLRRRLKQAQSEIKDLHDEFQVEKDDYLETIRSSERDLKLYMAIAMKLAGSELLQRFERESEWDDETEEWLLPDIAPAVAGASPDDSSLKKKKSGSSGATGPPTGIGAMAPGDGFDNAFSNDIMGDSDDSSMVGGGDGDEDPFADLDAQEQAGGGGGGGSMQGGGGKDTEFREQDGHYFNEDKADRRRGEAAKRVMNDATNLRSEVMSQFNMGNIVLWGAKPTGGGGGLGKADPLAGPARRAPHRLEAAPLGQRNQPAPLPLGKANNFIDVMADRRAESAVAADAARWEQQGPKKKMTGSDEMDFVKQMTSNGKGPAAPKFGGGAKLTL